MKKVFGQTVRDLKREVNKKVLKVSGIEQKVLDATSNEPWGPRGSDMAEVAQASRNYHEYQLIMSVVWRRINDTGKNWRHVYKALMVLEYLLAHGSERVIDEIKEHAYQISTLADFQYIDSNGKDQGSNIRRKSQGLVALVSCKERIQEIRQKAQSVKDKYNGGYRTRTSSNAGASTYVDRCDSGYNGNRDVEHNVCGKDDDRYGRGRDSLSKDGGRHSRDFDERYARDYREGRGRNNFDYQTRSRSLSVDAYSERPFGDDDRFSSRVGAPPSYEEAINVAQNSTQDERDGECEAAPTQVSSSSIPNPNSPSRSTGEGPDNAVASDIMASPNNKFDDFDEFDPRGFVSGAMSTSSCPELDIFGLSASDSVNPLSMVPATSTTTTTSSPELDIFGLSAPDSANSLAMVPVTSTMTTFEANVLADSGFGTNFNTFSLATNTNLPIENPFGDAPFKAIPQENFLSQLQNFQPATSFRPSGSSDGPDTLSSASLKVDSFSGFDFGDALGGLTYAPISVSGDHSSVNPPFLALELSGEQSRDDILDSILPRTTSAPPFSSLEVQSALSTNMQTAEMNPFQFSEFSVPVSAQGSSRNAETDQVNPFHMLELSAPVGSKEIPTNPDNLFLPSSGILASSTSPRAPTNIQAIQGNFLESSGPSVPAASQGSQTNMYQLLSSQSMVEAQPPDKMQTAHFNLSSLSMLSDPLAPQIAPAVVPNYIHATPTGAPAIVPNYIHATPTGAPANVQTAHFNLGSNPMLSDPFASQETPALAVVPPAKLPSKFEPKSTVWADTLSRGLVNFNISGPKTNPLDDIGVDFAAINRKEKRLEPKGSPAPVVSTITMGRAMGSGSGLGRAGSGGLAPPNPVMGSGMGMGMNMGDYGGNMSQPPPPPPPPMGMNMGVNMGMGQGPHGQPPTGMPGSGYNPMMGMGGFGMQQPYGGGYR